MLSSLLMAELPYDARMRFSEGASLTPSFRPTEANIPNLDRVSSAACAMFHVSPPADISGTTLNEWAGMLFKQWAKGGERITFFTSGSTGEPKPATHDFAAHVQEVHALAQIFSDRDRIVCFVPRHHIYGFLFSILLPKALDIPVKWEAPLPTPGLAAFLKPGDLMVAIPLLWRKLLEINTHFPKGIHGVTSTGPCPPNIIHGLRSNGLERMYEIYGSSETGGVGYRTDPEHGYSLLPHWTRTESKTSLIRVVPGQRELIHELQDVIRWDNSTFTPCRRTDNCVQVAGMNVYPARIRSLLTGLPGVKDCSVRLMRPDEGERLKAFIIPEQDSDISQLKSDLRAWTKHHLAPEERPRSWTFGRCLPTNIMGKESDW